MKKTAPNTKTTVSQKDIYLLLEASRGSKQKQVNYNSIEFKSLVRKVKTLRKTLLKL